ncbi:MAG: hypothetical protein OSJ41_09445 [Duncaniella sp.]|nr:hypothetical protein [Duncaniella sp.]
MKYYLQYLFQLILSPRNGWEDIDKAMSASGSRLTPSRIAAEGFYPLIAVAAVSVFIQALFKHHVVFLSLFMKMIITFVVYFISYFFSTFVLSVAVELMIEGEYDEQRCQTFTLFTLGMLAMISIIVNCLPITPLVLFFLPCYVALVQWKGCEYMHVRPDRIGHFMMLAILGVLLPPYIFYFIFSLIF